MTDDSLFLKGYNIKYTFTTIYIINYIYSGNLFFKYVYYKNNNCHLSSVITDYNYIHVLFKEDDVWK